MIKNGMAEKCRFKIISNTPRQDLTLSSAGTIDHNPHPVSPEHYKYNSHSYCSPILPERMPFFQRYNCMTSFGNTPLKDGILSPEISIPGANFSRIGALPVCQSVVSSFNIFIRSFSIIITFCQGTRKGAGIVTGTGDGKIPIRSQFFCKSP